MQRAHTSVHLYICTSKATKTLTKPKYLLGNIKSKFVFFENHPLSKRYYSCFWPSSQLSFSCMVALPMRSKALADQTAFFAILVVTPLLEFLLLLPHTLGLSLTCHNVEPTNSKLAIVFKLRTLHTLMQTLDR